MSTGRFKVLVAHPQLGVANLCKQTQLLGCDVTIATNLDRLEKVADSTFDGLVIADKFVKEGDGLAAAARLSRGQNEFKGLVVGIGSTFAAFNAFRADGIKASGSHGLSCQILCGALENMVPA